MTVVSRCPEQLSRLCRSVMCRGEYMEPASETSCTLLFPSDLHVCGLTVTHLPLQMLFSGISEYFLDPQVLNVTWHGVTVASQSGASNAANLQQKSGITWFGPLSPPTGLASAAILRYLVKGLSQGWNLICPDSNPARSQTRALLCFQLQWLDRHQHRRWWWWRNWQGRHDSGFVVG